jgi:multicomponent Na+:H+ antiporter subunit D
MNINLLLIIIIPLTTAILIPLLDLISIKIRKVIVFIGSIGELLVIIMILIENYQKIINKNFFLSYYLGAWEPHLGIVLTLDSLGLFFSILIGISFFLIVLYSIGFIGHHEGKYYVLLFLVFTAMQGVVLTGDIFNMYVFIELLTVSTTPLVAFLRTKEGIEAGIKYLVYGIIGGLIFFIGVILIYHSLGTLNMAEVAANFNNIPLRIRSLIVIIFLMSLIIKIGIFPFHFWLAKAHSSCPSSISAVLSGVLLKLYLYVFIRLFWIIFGFNILEELGLNVIIIYLGLISSTLGHIFAIQTEDIKRMLAFSSIGHIGMIFSTLALNTSTAFYGGLIHIMSHLFMKSALFLSAGYLLRFTKGHNIKDLSGIAYVHPTIFTSFFIVSLAMMGIPPLNGFVGKWYIVKAFLEAGQVFAVVLILIGSLLALLYYIRFINIAFKNIELDFSVKYAFVTKPLFPGFHREQLVILVILVFLVIVIFSGVFYMYLDEPILAAIEDILNSHRYINFVLGR